MVQLPRCWSSPRMMASIPDHVDFFSQEPPPPEDKARTSSMLILGLLVSHYDSSLIAKRTPSKKWFLPGIRLYLISYYCLYHSSWISYLIHISIGQLSDLPSPNWSLARCAAILRVAVTDIVFSLRTFLTRDACQYQVERRTKNEPRLAVPEASLSAMVRLNTNRFWTGW